MMMAAAQMIAAGFCMGIGFWTANKVTNIIEEKLLLYDSKKIEQLEKEMNLKPRMQKC